MNNQHKTNEIQAVNKVAKAGFSLLRPKNILITVTAGIGLFLFGMILAVFMAISDSGEDACIDNPTVDINQNGSDGSGGDWAKEGTEANKTAKAVFDHLTSTKNGLSGAGASGAVANAARESGFNLEAKNPSGGVAGLFQWSGYNGNTVNGSRWTSNGHDNNDFSLEGQLKLVTSELHGGYKGVRLQLAKETDPQEASKYWLEHYEGVSLADPQGKVEAMVQDAQTAYTIFNGSSIQGNVNASDDNAETDQNASFDSNSVEEGCTIDGDDNRTSTHLFDDEEKGIVLVDGIDGPAHNGKHDGWDIGTIAHPVNPDGPNFYALQSGVVVYVEQGNGQTKMPMVVVANENSKHYMTYMEFKKQSVPASIKVGASVQAGQKIGEMGSMFPNGETEGFLTSSGYKPGTFDNWPSDMVAASFGNHLHLELHSYDGDTAKLATRTNFIGRSGLKDPAEIFGLPDGTQSGKWTWNQLANNEDK